MLPRFCPPKIDPLTELFYFVRTIRRDFPKPDPLTEKNHYKRAAIYVHYILEVQIHSRAGSEECADFLGQATLLVDELEKVDAVDGGHVGALGRQHGVLQQRVGELAEVGRELDRLRDRQAKFNQNQTLRL